MMKDYLVKALACNEHVRIYICSSTHMAEEARKRFDLWPTSAATLGRVLTVGSMMGSMLKTAQEQITIRINGGGPIGTILVDAYSDGHVRGFVSDPHIMLQYNDTGKLAVGAAVGKDGYLEVVKDMNMKENWSGTVALQSGEIGDDVDTDNSILSAGGMIIQMLPDAEEEDIVKVEQIVANLRHMSTMIQEYESLEDILRDLFDDVRILTGQDIEFRCKCDRATMKRVLTTLPKEERQQMIEEDHGCEITCNFCGEKYQFSEEELLELERFMDAHAK